MSTNNNKDNKRVYSKKRPFLRICMCVNGLIVYVH